MSGKLHASQSVIVSATVGALKAITCCLVDTRQAKQQAAETIFPEHPDEKVLTVSGARRYLRETMAKCIEMIERAEAEQ
jgi:hypothetical protein